MVHRAAGVAAAKDPCLVEEGEIELSEQSPSKLCQTTIGRYRRVPHEVRIDVEKARRVDVAVEYIKEHKDVAVKIYAGYEDDIKTVNAVGGMLRAAYLTEKQKS